jgi:hypothetical protein
LKSDDFISSRIWRATISYRVAFEERRFHIESHLKSDDFISSRRSPSIWLSYCYVLWHRLEYSYLVFD